MKLSQIISQLRSRCPSFGGRVAGAAEFSGLSETTVLTTPCAYVIPDSEEAGDERGSTGYRQTVHVTFAVVVVCSSRKDERGQHAVYSIEDLRAGLFKALLLWSPDDQQSPVVYESAELLKLDRSRAWYRFEFGFDYQINLDDTWQSVQEGELGPLRVIDVDIQTTEGARAHDRYTFEEEG